MNAYTFLLIMILCGTEAMPNEFWPNVGSVLFTREDVNKQIWSKIDVALLTARRYFQKLIPPPSFITVENEFVDKMLAYFRDTYTAIKNVSPDQEVDKIMTTALSDTVGGYLKLCVLPVTKLSFYGGIASYDSAYKVFRFYSEIKKYLCTDGQNWRSPDQKMLNAIIVNVPKVVRQKKHMLNTNDSDKNKDPCTSFNYFENSPKGLVVPMPVVNWDDVSMFLPVHNESTFSLHSPKHCNTLENYYHKAKNCMNSKSEAVAADFDQKFQNWLSSNILPHLKDDRLYVALGNVLGLLNKTREMCDVILDVYNCSSKETPQNMKSIFCSKTTIIVVIILMFEIIWCVVAIDRLCCKKSTDFDDNDDDNNNRVLSYFRTCSGRDCMNDKTINTNEYEVNRSKETFTDKLSFMRKWSGHSKYTQMDYDVNCLPMTVEAGCQNEPSIKYEYPSIGVNTRSKSQSSFRYQIRSSDIFTIVNEKIKHISSNLVPITLMNKSYTKIPSTNSGVTRYDARDSCTRNSINLHDDSCSTVSRTKNKSAITIVRSEQSGECNQAIYQTRQVKDFQIRKTVNECKRNESELRPYSVTPVSCTCQNNADDSEVSIESEDKPRIKDAATDSLLNYCSQEEPLIVPTNAKTISKIQTVITTVNKETETKVEKKKNFVNKLTSPVTVNMPKDKKGKQSLRKRYLEIKIDRPKAEIKLGISDGQESTRKGQSKIPTQKSLKRGQNSTIKQPIAVTTILPELIDKGINSVIQCIEQSTDYTLTQEYTMYQVSAGNNGSIVNLTPQNHVKNYNVLESTLSSTQDVTTTSKHAYSDNRSITSKQEKGANTNSEEHNLSLMTIQRSESDLSKMSCIVVPCTNLKQDTTTESRNNAIGINQNCRIITDKERLIHTIYEQSKEALLSLATEDEKTVKEQNIGNEIIKSTDGSETQKKECYILSKCQVKTKESQDTSMKLTQTNIHPETSKGTKQHKRKDPTKKNNKQEQTPEIMKTKIPKRNNCTLCVTSCPPKTPLSKWNNSVELEQSCELSAVATLTTENVIEKSSLILKNSDSYGDTTCQRQDVESNTEQTSSMTMRKSKIPQLMRIDTRKANTLNTEVRLNLSF